MCSNNTQKVLPCGFAANTMFTDKIQWIKDRDGESQVKDWYLPQQSPFSQISNQGEQMKNPKLKRDLSYSLESDAYSPPPEDQQAESTQPEDWTEDMWKLYKENDPSFLEDFRVWMRLAPLPKFRKLWYRMGDLMPQLENGTIKIDVKWPKNDDSDLKIPNLRKKIILTQQSFFGAKCYNKCYIR